MPRFLFLYRDPVEKSAPELSADEMQAHMQKWWDWLGEGKEKGWVVEMGEALKPGGRIVNQDKTFIDGPHAEAKELIGGFSIIEAATEEEACEHALGCPIFETGGTVEVREINVLAEPV